MTPRSVSMNADSGEKAWLTPPQAKYIHGAIIELLRHVMYGGAATQRI